MSGEKEKKRYKESDMTFEKLGTCGQTLRGILIVTFKGPPYHYYALNKSHVYLRIFLNFLNYMEN